MPQEIHRTRRSLVTGGAGFIGSHLVDHLLVRGDEVTIIDNFSTGRRANVERWDPGRVRVIEGTVSRMIEGLDPGGFDEIYHLAAAVGVRLVLEKPIETIETNVHETASILRFAASGSASILIASTSEVYGKSTQTPFAEDDDVVYGPTIFSRWSYACSKAIDEYLALAWRHEHGLPVVIARFFNTVGPRQVGEYGMVLPRFVAAAIEGRALEVHGDGLQSRCFCDVRDVVPALTRLVETRECHGRVFNLGRDETISMLDLAKLVKRVLESDSEIAMVSYEKAFAHGFDDLRKRQPDLTRIRGAIGFSPRIPLEQTIRDLATSLKPTRATMGASSGPIHGGRV